MDWVDTTDDTVEAASALRQAFEVIRPVPTQATARVQKVQTGKGKDKRQALLQEKLLQAFPPVFPDESVDVRALRQAAYHQCWSALSQHLEDELEETNHATFQALLHFAASAHKAPVMSGSFAQRSRIIPTAMTFTGGVNSADHAHTFPTLVDLLRQQGCYAAILQPSQLPMGKGVSTAINSMLCQFSGLETHADDMLALQAWYQDMLTAPSGSGGTAASHKAPATPFGKLQLTTPIKTTRATAAAAAARRNGTADDKSPEVSPGGGATSPLAKLGIHTPKDKLTGRPQPDSLQAPIKQLTASQRPLVVVVEEAEAVDTLTLQDLILVLSETHAELPITLILGMATSAGALQQMLPVAAASMLEAQHFQLASSMERFETLVKKVLLGQRFPGVFFGHSVMRFINHQFMTHDFTTAVLRKGLQVACIAHFQHIPLSQLAPATMHSAKAEDMGPLIEAIPEAQFPFLRQQVLRSSQSEGACSRDEFQQQVTAELDKTCIAWSAWAVALRWINQAAAICEGTKPRPAYSLRVLYLDASSSKHAGSADKKHMLDQLCASLTRLPVDSCICVLQGLSTCVEQVWNGQAAMAQGIAQTQRLVEELKAGSPAKENQPQSQQPPASATTGAKPSTAPGPSKPVLAPSRRNAQHSSSANRQAAMRQQLESAKAKAQQAQQAKAAVSWQMTMAAKAANLLRCIVDQALDRPPAATAGAAVLCCGKAAASALQCLTAAPRLAVHEALSAPHKYLHTPYQISLSSKSDDACIAYQLFLEYGEAVDVADWFSGFCAIHGSCDGLPEEELAAPVPKPKKPRGRPSKKVLQRDESEPGSTSAGAAAARQLGPREGSRAAAQSPQHTSTPEARPARSRLARQTGVGDTAGPSGDHLAAPTTTSGRALRSRQSTAAHAAASKSSEPDGDAANEDAADEGASQAGPQAEPEAEAEEAAGRAVGGKSLEELAVRFSQATKELQVLGLLRPARKRRGDFAQKLVFHSGHADMEISCEA